MDRVLQRRDTAANWSTTNPILAEGEIGIITDGAKGYKIGDGVTRWNALEYPANPTSVVGELGNSEVAVVNQKVTTSISKDLARTTSLVWWNSSADLPYEGYINSSGAVVAFDGSKCTDFIEIPIQVQVQTIGAFLKEHSVIAIYDSKKSIKRFIDYTQDPDEKGNVYFQLNDDERYVRVSFEKNKENIGIRYTHVDNNTLITEQIDTLEEITKISIDVSNTFSGYINKEGKIISASISRYSQKISIKPKQLVIIEKPFIQDAASVCTFDNNQVLVRSFNDTNTDTNPKQLKFEALENEAYFIASFTNSSIPTNIFKSINGLIDSSTDFGEVYRKDIPFSTGGYINTNGYVTSISSSTLGYTDYIALPKNILFKIPNWTIDNASVAFYDKDKINTRVITSTDAKGQTDIILQLQNNEEYFRTSVYQFSGDTISIYFAQYVEKIDIMNSINSIPSTSNETTCFTNILTAFDNIICIGDSLTYSQVYTSTSDSRRSKVTYPQALSRLCGNSQTTLARSGATAKSCWDEFSSQIVQKDNSLAIIYLGTNAGITDTLSTDVIGDNPDTWADNNIGCYCRFIQKLQQLGTKVLLLRIWATSGTGQSSLINTNNAITHIAERFNCAVMDTPVNKDLKYHYYPDLTGSNGVHYNELGYSWFASNLIQKIGELEDEQMKLLIPNA